MNEHPSIGMTLEWVRERLENSDRLASLKTGKDREGWLEDTKYWRAITEYLSTGGLFNPELANHDAVRDLLLNTRERIKTLEAWEELWRAIKEMEPKLGDANKPLAIAASYALLQSRIGNAVEVLDSIRAILRWKRDPELYTDRHDAARIVEMINGFLATAPLRSER